MPSSCSSTRSGRTSARTSSAPRSTITPAAGAASAGGRPLSPLTSRILVAVVGLPLVLALVYAGGWWLFALVAVGTVLALHEYALMTRSLRPVTLAAYAGALLALLGAELGGLEWTLAGFLSTIVLAFVLHWVGQTRQSATVAIAATVLGAAWIGLCLAHMLLLRDGSDHGRLATFAV